MVVVFAWPTVLNSERSSLISAGFFSSFLSSAAGNGQIRPSNSISPSKERGSVCIMKSTPSVQVITSSRLAESLRLFHRHLLRQGLIADFERHRVDARFDARRVFLGAVQVPLNMVQARVLRAGQLGD